MDLWSAWSLLISVMFLLTNGSSAPNEGCMKQCGKFNISYPFGVEEGCYFEEEFKMICNNSYENQESKLFIGGPYFRYEVSDISLHYPKITILRETGYKCDETRLNWDLDLYGTAFRVSSTDNVFVALGCNTDANIQGEIEGFNYSGRCTSMCEKGKVDAVNGSCDGRGCCKINIPQGIQSYYTSLDIDKRERSGVAECMYSFMVEKNKYSFSVADLNMSKRMTFPVVLDWSLRFNSKVSCKDVVKNNSNYACVSEYSECYDNTEGRGYNCKCREGYHGNPYLRDGCQDINQCEENSPCKHDEICVNAQGEYRCFKEVTRSKKLFTALISGLSGGIFIILLTASSIFIYKRSQKIQKKRTRRNNLNQNSKQLEMKLMSSHGDTVERTKIFTLKEMQKATDNFNKTRIIGQGGHGTVYKGLLSDQRVTAIKSSKLMNQIEKEEFINEVALLSRIYHRNVVMLYGCCLETEVPLLAYEFVSNGTLSDHLHQLHVRDPYYYLCWKDRLRIATQTSSAIAYLHSASSKTIFHRDLKSANILLDEKLNAKISDFGASKYVTSDQTHITATVQGTIGYLDPEYYQSGKLTEKSDVYSLGVILVELFTGEKPISNARIQEQRNIIMHFLKLLNENKVEQIFDTHLVKEAPKEEVEVFARLAGDCLNYKSEERPTMKEVVSTLEGMMRSKIKKKGSIIQEESKQPLLSFDISSPENSSWSTSAQQNTTTQSSI